MHQSGSVAPSVTLALVLGLVSALLVVFGAWAFINYQDQKNNVDAKIAEAVTVAQVEQKTEDEAAFAEREKSPAVPFVGPEDLGKVSFEHPKTWSVFIGEDGTKGKFESYYHPDAVVSPTRKIPYALRLTIADQEYEAALKGYQPEVAKGELVASPITVNDQVGTRLDGTFSSTVKGSMVLLKLRDKTIMIYTEAEDYLDDFNSIVIPSFKFNP
ncbi:MAG TPA: hypothetical protein VFT87_01165 [Candidatus Saccharimonadales bacterium]|nr:hypothetical protein [Candidatus Saccharimonadales bacterium]